MVFYQSSVDNIPNQLCHGYVPTRQATQSGDARFMKRATSEQHSTWERSRCLSKTLLISIVLSMLQNLFIYLNGFRLGASSVFSPSKPHFHCSEIRLLRLRSPFPRDGCRKAVFFNFRFSRFQKQWPLGCSRPAQVLVLCMSLHLLSTALNKNYRYDICFHW